MRPGIMAARSDLAQDRLTAASAVLGGRFGLAPQAQALQEARARDPQLQALMQREAMADLLEALVRATDPGQTLPDDSERAAGLTVAELRERIDAADADALDAIEEAERGGKNRKGVMAAIEERRAALVEQAEQATGDEQGGIETDAAPTEGAGADGLPPPAVDGPSE